MNRPRKEYGVESKVWNHLKRWSKSWPIHCLHVCRFWDLPLVHVGLGRNEQTWALGICQVKLVSHNGQPGWDLMHGVRGAGRPSSCKASLTWHALDMFDPAWLWPWSHGAHWPPFWIVLEASCKTRLHTLFLNKNSNHSRNLHASNCKSSNLVLDIWIQGHQSHLLYKAV